MWAFSAQRTENISFRVLLVGRLKSDGKEALSSDQKKGEQTIRTINPKNS